MNAPALTIDALAKSFRVPHAPGDADPRREPDGRRHDRFWALREVAFEVPAGATLGIVGANGSGKSTLLKILSGVMTPTAGRFEASGRVGALLELGAGFHPDLSGIENVYLNGALLGMDTRAIDRVLPEIIAFAELERFMDMPVKHYSSGMTARLGFAVATRLAPEILLMDETFATGDARFQAKALDHVAQMRGRGHTLLLVSHNLDLMLNLADRVLWLDQGQVRRIGPPHEVIADYQRNQQMGLHHETRLRSALGMGSLFAGVAEGTPVVRLAEVRLAPGGGGAAEDDSPHELPAGLVRIAEGSAVTLDLTLAHEADPPARVAIETAWVRADHRIVAQSRSFVELAGGRTSTRCRLGFAPWPLAEGSYRLAVALTPVGAEGTDFLHYDRRLDCGVVQVTTPNTQEIAALIRPEWSWSA